jgi:hypothetical protein
MAMANPQSCCKCRVLSNYNLNYISHTHDHNAKLGGSSFKAHYKYWMKDPMVIDFLKWAAESFGQVTIFFERQVLTPTLSMYP